MDCANVTKITAPSSAKRYFPPPPPPLPPDEHVLYKDSFASGNGEQVDTNKLLIWRPGG